MGIPAKPFASIHEPGFVESDTMAELLIDVSRGAGIIDGDFVGVITGACDTEIA